MIKLKGRPEGFTIVGSFSGGEHVGKAKMIQEQKKNRRRSSNDA